MRTLVIGDIHGGLIALKQVLERANVTTEDKLIFLGDYVDGWSDSANVIQFLMDLSQQQECIFIKGNHDEYCEEYLELGVSDEVWIKHGGKLTRQNYQELSTEVRQAHLAFFQKMKLFEIDDKNRLFIHAGFTSMKGPEHEHHPTNCYWDRTLWEVAITTDVKIPKHSPLYPQRLKLFEEIFIGHTPTVQYQCKVPMHCINVWNVDTGAAFKGKLTILDIDTKEYWQSDQLNRLYPNEKGRN